jgi:hypothetical protein
MTNARENVNLLTSADWDIATLRLANWGSGAVPPQVILKNNHAAGDGGGLFRYDASDTTTADNGSTVIVDAAGNRWKRQSTPVEIVLTKAALKSVALPSSGKVYSMGGRLNINDDGGGLFYWTSDNVASEVADDPQEGIYVPLTGQNGSSGSFVRMFQDAYNVKWFGATGDGTTNDTTAIEACRDAAAANLGLHQNPVGYPTLIFPVGKYKVTGVTIDVAGERWIGYGARIDAAAAGQFVVRVAAAYVVLEDLQLYNPFFPNTGNGVLEHTAGSDCAFRKLNVTGGYYGFKLTGGGDSHFEDCKVVDAYADFVYLQGYSGMWCVRGKFDGRWPVQEPVAANDKGAWTTSTAYVVGDVVSNSNWYFQCHTAGTSASSGAGPQAALLDTNVTDGTAVWRTHRYTNGAGLNIDSGCFINEFLITDVTGGHIHCVRVNNSLATTAPQNVVFNASEAGAGFANSFLLTAGNGVWISNSLIHNSITTNGIGVNAGTVEHLHVSNNEFWGHDLPVYVAATSVGVKIDGNTFAGATTCVSVVANTNNFTIMNNYMGSSAIWGNNVNGINIAAGTSNYYQIFGNIFNGSTGTKISDGGSGTTKTVQTTEGALSLANITTSATDFLHKTSAALANGAAAQSATLTNAPVAGNPTKWIAISDNGTTRYIPTWSS